MIDTKNLPPKKDKVTAALLAWFLGVFGAHQFYLGNTGKGCTFLVTCIASFSILSYFGYFILFILGISAFIDAVSLFLMNQERFDQLYNPKHFVANLTGQMGGGSLHPPVNVADELMKLNELLRQGVINFEEFERRKQRLLNS